MIVGFEIRPRCGNGPMCVWGDCAPGERRLRKEATRGLGFADVVILGRETFPACRRHRKDVEAILCSLLCLDEAEPTGS